MARTGRPKKHVPEAVKRSVAIGSPPSWLSDSAKKEWKRIAPELEAKGGLQGVDTGALACYCQACAEVQSATETIDAQGRTFTTEKGFVLEHPAAKAQRAAMDRLYKFASVLGLDPQSRGKIKVPLKVDAVDPILDGNV